MPHHAPAGDDYSVNKPVNDPAAPVIKGPAKKHQAQYKRENRSKR